MRANAVDAAAATGCLLDTRRVNDGVTRVVETLKRN